MHTSSPKRRVRWDTRLNLQGSPSLARRALFVLLAGSALAAPASSQTVDEVIARHLQARGGLEKIKAVRSMRMTGTMTAGPGLEVPVTLEQKRPASVRLDITFEGRTGSQAYDGQTGWSKSPMVAGAVAEPMSAEDLSQMEEQADLDGPLVDTRAKGHTVALVGKTRAEGSDAYRLKLTLKTGETRYVSIDAQSYLERKTEAKRVIQGREVDMEIVSGDYREVGGLILPFAVTQGAKDQPQKQTITFATIELNVPLDDARFKMPAPTKP